MSRNKKLKILVSNDDGFESIGIQTLAKVLEEIADVFVVAPLLNCSGNSYALTLNRYFPVAKHKNRLIVYGTPADCIHVALHNDAVLPWRPDLTITGINNGCNLGYDTLYSGTVSGAAESAMQEIPSIAFSLACMPGDNYPPVHFDVAGKVVKELVLQLKDNLMKNKNMMLNINIPDLPEKDIRKPIITKLKNIHVPRKTHELSRDDNIGIRRYQMSFNTDLKSNGEKNDMDVVYENHISITPLQFDMTAYKDLNKVEDWI